MKRGRGAKKGGDGVKKRDAVDVVAWRKREGIMEVNGLFSLASFVRDKEVLVR